MIKEKMTCIPYHAENTSIHILTFSKTQLFHKITWDGVVDKTSTNEQALITLTVKRTCIRCQFGRQRDSWNCHVDK